MRQQRKSVDMIGAEIEFSFCSGQFRQSINKLFHFFQFLFSCFYSTICSRSMQTIWFVLFFCFVIAIIYIFFLFIFLNSWYKLFLHFIFRLCLLYHQKPNQLTAYRRYLIFCLFVCLLFLNVSVFFFSIQFDIFKA